MILLLVLAMAWRPCQSLRTNGEILIAAVLIKRSPGDELVVDWQNIVD